MRALKNIRPYLAASYINKWKATASSPPLTRSGAKVLLTCSHGRHPPAPPDRHHSNVSREYRQKQACWGFNQVLSTSLNSSPSCAGCDCTWHCGELADSYRVWPTRMFKTAWSSTKWNNEGRILFKYWPALTNLLRKGSELLVVIVLNSWDIPGEDTAFWVPPSCSSVGNWLRSANSLNKQT